jgi:hypothetical protein
MNWHIGWQDLLAAAVVVWAVGYLCRRVLGVVRRDPVTGCGTCRGCGGEANRSGRGRHGYVPVESLRASADSGHREPCK